MWRRILSFFGWLLTGFFILIGLVGLTQDPAIALAFIIWGLIFLPPLFRFTSSYGLAWNIGGRVAVFFVSAVIAGMLASPEPQVTQSTPPVTTTPAGITATEYPTSNKTTTPTLEPTSEPVKAVVPEVTKILELKPTPTPVKPAFVPAPEVIKTPEPKAIAPEPKPKPTQAPQVNLDAPVRASVSGKCDCPYDTDRRGRSCGKRSAYSRPGGRSPICYVRDQQ